MNNSSSRTSLFLIELVLSIFFFIVVITICLQLFMNTFFLNREATETNQALLWSQNLAEPFLGSNGNYSVLKTLFADYDCISELPLPQADSLLLCFDKDWNPVSHYTESTYIVFSVFDTDEIFAYQHIYIAKSPVKLIEYTTPKEITSLLCEESHNIYQLSVKKFLPGNIPYQKEVSTT